MPVPHPHFSQKQHRHKQRIGPQLLRVAVHIVPIRVIAGHMLKTAPLGSGQGLDQIIRPFHAQFFPCRPVVPFRQFKQGQERGGRIDVGGRQTDSQVVFHPIQQKGVIFPRSPGRLQLQQTVQAHALRPVPFPDAEVPGVQAFFHFLRSGGLVHFYIGGIQVHQFIHHQIQFLIDQFFVHQPLLLSNMQMQNHFSYWQYIRKRVGLQCFHTIHFLNTKSVFLKGDYYTNKSTAGVSPQTRPGG